MIIIETISGYPNIDIIPDIDPIPSGFIESTNYLTDSFVNFKHSSVLINDLRTELNTEYPDWNTLTSDQKEKMSSFGLGTEAERVAATSQEIEDARISSETTVTTSDVEIADPEKGLILACPDGSRCRVTVDSNGILITTIL